MKKVSAVIANGMGEYLGKTVLVEYSGEAVLAEGFDKAAPPESAAFLY